MDSTKQDGGGAGQPPPPAVLPMAGSLDLSKATTANVQIPGIAALPAINAGYSLARIFACILAGYSIVAWIGLLISESHFTAQMEKITSGYTLTGVAADPNKIANFEAALKPIVDAFRQTRSDAIEFHKTVIVNVLLPVLTLLLGYIFANRTTEAADKNK